MEGTVYDPIFSEEEKSFLKKYVSNTDGDIFVFTPALAGLGGAILARYSRAPGSSRVQLLKEFLDEKGELKIDKAQKTTERILVGYGDDSVGEFESAQLCVENRSNLNSKEMEDVMIGISPIEKSTRYVENDKKNSRNEYNYLRPKEIYDAELKIPYETGMDRLFYNYSSATSKMKEHLKKVKPRETAEYAIKSDDERGYKLSELTEEKDIRAWTKTYATDVKTKACDIVRGLLPAATLTNVGLAGNGRGFQNQLFNIVINNKGFKNSYSSFISSVIAFITTYRTKNF